MTEGGLEEKQAARLIYEGTAQSTYRHLCIASEDNLKGLGHWLVLRTEGALEYG